MTQTHALYCFITTNPLTRLPLNHPRQLFLYSIPHALPYLVTFSICSCSRRPKQFTLFLLTMPYKYLNYFNGFFLFIHFYSCSFFICFSLVLALYIFSSITHTHTQLISIDDFLFLLFSHNYTTYIRSCNVSQALSTEASIHIQIKSPYNLTCPLICLHT